ncbi:MAG: CIA30 family protein [Akkermansiaceae bacterium]|nr:CIA30 family protein [Akkermansiaceae bacterium]MCF7731539.1 CIA30 family protein [Akkermansiaceae bacterium]
MKTTKPYSPARGGLIATALGALLTQLPLLAAQQELATFKTADSLESWTSVNDGVMGGVSKGGFKRTEQGTLLFSGELSLENNGGFASVRTKPGKFELSGTTAIVVKARGDGRTYWLDLRTAGQMGATSYRAYLPTTAGEWQETRIPFADFKPQAFGRALPFKAINPAAVASIGFTLADKNAGPFSLEIESVTATDEQAAPANADAKSGRTLVEVAKAAGGFNGTIHVIDQVLIPATPEAAAPSPTGLIELAIKRGVPLFNKGEAAACAALYEVTCEALQVIDGVSEKSRAELARVLKAARSEASDRKRAWILRDGMDRAWASLKK